MENKTTPYRVIEANKETYKALGKDDILYGVLLSYAVFEKENGQMTNTRRIRKEKWLKRKDGIRAQVCKLFGGCTTRKVNTALERLIKNGLIQEEKDFYIIPEKGFKDKYVKIDTDLLRYLCNSYSSPALSVYCYLKWKYYCATKYNDNKNRVFTISKMLEDMGYAPTRNDRIRQLYIDCLAALQEGNIIKFHKYYEPNEIGGMPLEKHYLDFVAEKIPEKSQETIEELQEASKKEYEVEKYDWEKDFPQETKEEKKEEPRHQLIDLEEIIEREESEKDFAF